MITIKLSNLIDKYILMKSLKENGLDVGVFSKIDSKNDFLNVAKKLDILLVK